MKPRLITVKEAAARLNVSIDTVYRLVHAGVILGTRVTRRCIRVNEQSLEAHIVRKGTR
ncbi:MAG: excisionase family DNA-binding protein [Verrucomicrobiae bacterium]|nr:excisionase family DNA-binding protein [Verrucomicrobiae bacterium]